MTTSSACARIPCSVNPVMSAMTKSHITTYLEQRLLPMIIQLFLCPEGHRSCLGNRNTAHLELLSTVLLPTDTSEAITEVLLVDVSRALVKRVDTIWEA